MRRKFTIFAVVAMILVAIAACSKDELGVEVIVPQQEQMDSYRVSVDEALRSAETILRAGDRDTRSAARRVKSTELYVAKPATRSNENTEVSFYLINYEDNAGYALVSTDERTTPVYMYAEEGNITTEAFEEVPPLAIFMEEAIANYEAEVASSGADEPIDIGFPPGVSGKIGIYNGIQCYISVDSTSVVKGPYCTARWNQGEPYNAHCNPPHYVGCGPVAIGQVMAYYQHPASQSGYSFNWSLINSQPYYTSLSTPGAADLALFLRRIGDIAGADYTDADYPTGISASIIPSTFQQFEYTTSGCETYTSSLAKVEINNNRPFVVWGTDDDGGCHAWVIDGYESHLTITRYNELNPPYALIHSETTEILYINCNIGWGHNSYESYRYSTLDIYHNSIGMVRNIQPTTE